MEPDVNLLVHLLAFAVYAGATVAIAVISLPAARAEVDAERRLRAIAAAMRVYDPLSIAALGVLVMTGAFALTAYKAALRAAFFERLGGVLAWKLFFTFLLINLGAYIAFGLGNRLVGRAHLDAPVEEIWLRGMLSRLQVSLVAALLLVVVIVWVAIQLPRGAAVGPVG